MTQLKPMICAALLTVTLASTALAGNIPTRSGNIATRTGNIPTRSGNIATRTGNIPTRSGNIATRTGIVSPGIVDSQSGLSDNIGRLVRLLLENGFLF